MANKPVICIVTSGPIASDPRVVKAADALAAAGYQVRVVATDLLERVRVLDQTLLTENWQLLRAGRGTRAGWLVRTAFEHLCRRLWRYGLRTRRVAEYAQGRQLRQLTRLAVSTHAALYIGHNLTGLAAAGRAAEYHAARLGFDAEDDHPGEIEYQPGDPLEVARRVRVLDHWLPRCAIRTAAAPMIAEHLTARFGVDFTPLLNVFPRAHAPDAPLPIDPKAPPSIYWFSQTIGAGRGLEQLIAILGRCRTAFSLDLRGSVSADYQSELRAVAGACGLPDQRLRFLASAAPAQMSRLAVGYALGASVEVVTCANKRACLGNKIFQYLLAGTPVLLSDTPAQAQLAQQLGPAAVLISLTDTARAAATLDAWYADAAGRERAAQTAWHQAQTRFNWDTEQAVLLARVDAALRTPPEQSSMKMKT